MAGGTVAGLKAMWVVLKQRIIRNANNSVFGNSCCHWVVNYILAFSSPEEQLLLNGGYQDAYPYNGSLTLGIRYE